MPDLPSNTPAQPKQPTKPKAGPILVIVVAVLVVIGIVNSGDDEPTPSASGAPAAVADEPEVGVDAADPADGVGTDAALPEDTTAATAVVPDVVGLNHQLAQDTLQANGFYLLLEEDATGQGRMLLYDRNWEVVAQSVPAGTTVSTAEPITLYSKKVGE